MEKYDLIVIGSGPAGEKAAVKAAYFLHKVALIEKGPIFGGAASNLALPTKTLKETALYLSGKYDKGLYGIDRHVESNTSIEQFMYRESLLKNFHSKAVLANLMQHQVKVYSGTASFKDAHEIEVSDENGKETIYGDYVLIATGCISSPPKNIPIDQKRVHVTETMLNIKRIPSSICIIGAGVIGCEFATIFSTLGVKVFLVNRSTRILSFCDSEIVQNLLEHMERDGIELLVESGVKSIEIPDNESQMLKIAFDSEKILEADMILFSTNRIGQLKDLNCNNAGVKIEENGLLKVNQHFQTNIPHIYAAGDIIGFPSLANVGMDQGRVAVSHMFQLNDMTSYSTENLPYGIYTIPEISTVGISEEKAIQLGIDYCVGKSFHSDVVRGIIMGAKYGLLKLVFDHQTQIILGVHIIGHLASELIHYGVELVQNKKTLTDIISKNYNFPSLHELYKYAAFDGLSTLTGRKMKQHIFLEDFVQ